MEKSIKIFVICGTQKFPFSRLIHALNRLIEEGIYQPSDIVMQSQINKVKPLFKIYTLLPVEEFEQYMKEAEVVISHAGVNSIISCMKLHKPLLITPRQVSFGEHVDNHQVEIASLMADKFEVTVDYDLDNLKQTLEIAKRKEYKPWVSDKNELITALRNDIINFL